MQADDEPGDAPVGEWLPLSEVARASGLTVLEIHELVEWGLVPMPGAGGEPRLSVEQVVLLRRASALRRDYDLDLFAMGLLLDQLVRIDALERELAALRARTQPPAVPGPLQVGAPWDAQWRER